MLAVILLVALLVVVFALMRRGWRARQRRQADVPAPQRTGELGEPLAGAAGMYVVTTSAGDWLDRVAVHGLGVRTDADLTVHPGGVLIARRGADDVVIPTADLESVTTTSGMAGKFVERDGLLVLTWRLGPRRVDTGFRVRHAGEQAALIAALLTLPGVRRRETPGGVPEAEPAPGTGPTEPPDSTDTSESRGPTA
ncbi:PH-like domain-containing protein [Tersicoccus phoenicis]|uniref:PH-like domain-containing protein n=1 Tax=Tersicoccus phoenicis TaxID=554083 RepID=UPI002E25B777